MRIPFFPESEPSSSLFFISRSSTLACSPSFEDDLSCGSATAVLLARPSHHQVYRCNSLALGVGESGSIDRPGLFPVSPVGFLYSFKPGPVPVLSPFSPTFFKVLVGSPAPLSCCWSGFSLSGSFFLATDRVFYSSFLLVGCTSSWLISALLVLAVRAERNNP